MSKNRILRYLKHGESSATRRSATADIPSRCSYCGQGLEGARFVAISKKGLLPVPAAMCAECVDRYAMTSCLSSWFRLYYAGNLNWDDMRAFLSRRLDGELGTKKMKQAVVEAVILMTKRSMDTLLGKPCQRSRIALVGEDSEECLDMLRIAAHHVGLPLMQSDIPSLENGLAYDNMKFKYFNGDNTMSEHSVIFATGITEMAFADCAVVFACQAAPPDGNAIQITTN